MDPIDPTVKLQRVSLDVQQLAPYAEQLPRCTAQCRDGMQCMFSAKYAVNGQPICGSHVGRPSLIFVRPPRRR